MTLDEERIGRGMWYRDFVHDKMVTKKKLEIWNFELLK